MGVGNRAGTPGRVPGNARRTIIATNQNQKGGGDEFIDPTEVRVSPRGRKAVIDPALVEALKAIPKGKVARMGKTIGKVESGERAKVSAVIRKHWKVAFPGTECRIDWDPQTGVPQVRHK